MVRLERKGLDYFYTPDSYKELRVIEKSLSFPVEGAIFSELYRSGKWDGNAKFYNKRKCSFNFGLLELVLEKLKEKGIVCEVKDEREKKFPFAASDLIFKTDREYQIQSVKKFIEVREGVLKIFTRLGKTVVFSEITKNFLRKYPDMIILFVCDTRDLLLQAIEDLKNFGGIEKSFIGKITGGSFKISKVTFCTVQTLDAILNRKVKIGNDFDSYYEKKAAQKAHKKELLEFLEKVDFLVVDECHEFGSDARLGILRKICNTEFRLFLSATPFSNNSKKMFSNLNIRSMSGEIFFEMGEKEGVEQGYLAKSKVLLLMINHEKNKNLPDSDYQDLVDKVIVNNDYRNGLIVNVIETLRKLNLKSLVLFFYEKHAKNISKITEDTYVYGGTDLKIRKNVKGSFLRGKGKILLATNIFKKGITFPQVQVLVNAAGGKDENNIIQKKGRALGISVGKDKAMIIDFIDIFDYFSEHSFNRIKAYTENTGKENVVVLDTDSEDFYFDFRNLIMDWFGK